MPTEITVKLADGRELEATLVGRDEATDLAVIKVEGTDFPFVSFEEAAQPRVGDWVIAVGNPFGLGGTATAGIVSALARDILDSRTPYTDFLQIDAAINTGNSGGPTFDIYGRVIGVNSAIFSPDRRLGRHRLCHPGLGRQADHGPADARRDDRARLSRASTIRISTGPMREALGLPDDFKGAYVDEVTPGGPAAKAGLSSRRLSSSASTASRSTARTEADPPRRRATAGRDHPAGDHPRRSPPDHQRPLRHASGLHELRH